MLDSAALYDTSEGRRGQAALVAYYSAELGGKLLADEGGLGPSPPLPTTAKHPYIYITAPIKHPYMCINTAENTWRAVHSRPPSRLRHSCPSAVTGAAFGAFERKSLIDDRAASAASLYSDGKGAARPTEQLSPELLEVLGQPTGSRPTGSATTTA